VRVKTPDNPQEVFEEFNPWDLPRPEHEYVEKQFGPIKVRLKPLDSIEIADVMAETQRLTLEYIGDSEGMNADGEEAQDFLGPDGETYELNPTIIQEICFLRGMEPEDRRRSFSWWIGVATRCSGPFRDASNFAGRLQRTIFGPEGNSTREESSIMGSSTPLSSLDNGTQSSTGAETT
jgi:hypothetical protein